MSQRQLQLTPQQQQLLLRGLRFVRSSVALDISDYSDQVDAERRRQYAEISRLESLLQEVPVAESARV